MSPARGESINGSACPLTFCRRFAALKSPTTTIQGSQSLALGLAPTAAPQLPLAATSTRPERLERTRRWHCGSGRRQQRGLHGRRHGGGPAAPRCPRARRPRCTELVRASSSAATCLLNAINSRAQSSGTSRSKYCSEKPRVRSGPSAYTPGTKMPEQRIGSEQDRKALTDFLERATK